jgi:hypothetical protein
LNAVPKVHWALPAEPELDPDPELAVDPELDADPELVVEPELDADPELDDAAPEPEPAADPELDAELCDPPELGAPLDPVPLPEPEPASPPSPAALAPASEAIAQTAETSSPHDPPTSALAIEATQAQVRGAFHGARPVPSGQLLRARIGSFSAPLRVGAAQESLSTPPADFP